MSQQKHSTKKSQIIDLKLTVASRGMFQVLSEPKTAFGGDAFCFGFRIHGKALLKPARFRFRALPRSLKT